MASHKKKPFKSLWKEKQYWQFYCPVCKELNRVHIRSNPASFLFYVQVVLITIFLMILGWPFFGVKGGILFFVVWLVYEGIHRMRARMALRCYFCGYDPYVFMHSPEKGRRLIEARLQDKVAQAHKSVSQFLPQSEQNAQDFDA